MFASVMILLATMAAPTALQDGKDTNDPRLYTAYERLVAYLQAVPRYDVSVRLEWRAEEGQVGAAPLDGVNHYRMALERPGKFRIEVRPGDGQSASLVTVSDGHQVTTFYPAKVLYSRGPLLDPREGLDQNPILAVSLEGSLLDTLMRPDLVDIVRGHASAGRFAGAEKVEGQELEKYTLRWRGDEEELWIGPVDAPLPRKLVRKVTVLAPGGDGAVARLVTTATLTWSLPEVPLTPDTFTVVMPPEAVEVDDIYAALASGTTGMLQGKPAPALELPRLEEGRPAATLAEQAGRIVILGFWATWAAPSVERLPSLGKVARDYADKDVVLLPVHVGPEADAAREVLKQQPQPLDGLIDAEGNTADAYGISSVPALVLIGRDGVVRAFIDGTSEDLEARLRGELDGLITDGSTAPTPPAQP